LLEIGHPSSPPGINSLFGLICDSRRRLGPAKANRCVCANPDAMTAGPSHPANFPALSSSMRRSSAESATFGSGSVGQFTTVVARPGTALRVQELAESSPCEAEEPRGCPGKSGGFFLRSAGLPAGTTGCPPRCRSSRPPISPLRARSVMQGAVENRCALVFFGCARSEISVLSYGTSRPGTRGPYCCWRMSFKARSHSRSGLRSPVFASSTTLLAIACLTVVVAIAGPQGEADLFARNT
jgi:hypothetical protein